MQTIKTKAATRLLTLLLTGLALGFSGLASAVPMTWALQDVQFNDQTSLVGSFVYDATTNNYSNWSLSVKNGALTSFTYQAGNSNLFGLSDNDEFMVIKNNYGRYLNLNFVAPLTNAGGTVALELADHFISMDTGSWECDNCSTFRWVTSGSVTSNPTPVSEPGSLALFGLALSGLAISRRKAR